MTTQMYNAGVMAAHPSDICCLVHHVGRLAFVICAMLLQVVMKDSASSAALTTALDAALLAIVS